LGNINIKKKKNSFSFHFVFLFLTERFSSFSFTYVRLAHPPPLLFITKGQLISKDKEKSEIRLVALRMILVVSHGIGLLVSLQSWLRPNV
jgi:hypothetical protein